jgi:hypothetical protein
MAKHGVNVPRGIPAKTLDEVEAAAKELDQGTGEVSTVNINSTYINLLISASIRLYENQKWPQLKIIRV